MTTSARLLVGGLAAGLDRCPVGHLQGADGLHDPIPGLRGAGGLTGLHRPGGGACVGRVGLAVTAPRTAVGPIDLDHDQPLGVQPAGQPGTPAAGALDPEPVDDPKR